MKRVRTYTALCLLLGGWLAAGCEAGLTADAPADAPTAEGGRVVFSLPMQAVTRATASRQTPAEQAVSSLLAVAFQNDGAQTSATRADDEASTPFYAAVPVDLTSVVSAQPGGDDADFSFELGEEGTFRVCFLANVRQDLAARLMAREPGSFTLGEFKDKLVDQDPGGSDTGGALLMTSQYFKLTTSFTQPVNLGTVTLTRAMARVDLENAADGITVTRIIFANRADKTRLFNDSHTGLDADCLQADGEEYDLSDAPLVGSSTQPALLATPLYSYEQMATAAANPGQEACLDIRYVMPSVSATREYSHKVYFNTPDGQTMPLKRNTLYHVRMTNAGVDPVFSIEVEDWTEGAHVAVADTDLAHGVKK